MKKLISIIFALAVALTTACATGNGADASSASSQSAKPNGGETLEKTYNVKITAGSKVLHAKFYDNAATRALLAKMPFTYSMQNLYSREMCYRMGHGALSTLEAADTGYEIGDISYWPPAGSLVILYKQNGEVFEQQPIGHTDDDVSFFSGMGTTKVTFERE